VKTLEGNQIKSENQEIAPNVQAFFSNPPSSNNAEDTSSSKSKSKLQYNSKEYKIVQKAPETILNDPAIISQSAQRIEPNIDPSKKYDDKELLAQVTAEPPKIIDVSQLESSLNMSKSQDETATSIDLKKLQDSLSNQNK